MVAESKEVFKNSFRINKVRVLILNTQSGAVVAFTPNGGGWLLENSNNATFSEEEIKGIIFDALEEGFTVSLEGAGK